jgi:hypothetical protein
MGMHCDSVHACDNVWVTFHVMKDGTRGGRLSQVTLLSGKQVARADARGKRTISYGCLDG